MTRDELCRDPDGAVSIDYSNDVGMLSMSLAPNGSLAWAVLLKNGDKSNGVAWLHDRCFAVIDAELSAAMAPTGEPK
jgi:hypothetical protein